MAVSTDTPTAPLPHVLHTAHLTIAEAANRLRVHPRTVRRWVKSGDLPAQKQACTGGFQYAIPASEVDKRVPESTDILPIGALGLDKGLNTLESLSNTLSNIQDNIQGAVQEIVKPIVQGQQELIAEVRGLREDLKQREEAPKPRPWYKRLWQRSKGGNDNG